MTKTNDHMDEEQQDYSISRRSVLQSIPLAAGLASFGGLSIYGTGQARAQGSVLLLGVEQETGKLFEVDAGNGDSTELVDLKSLANSQNISLSFSTSTPNGNAYDVEENRFYFTSFPGAATLYFVDLDENQPSITLAGSLDAPAASGTITIDDDGKAFYYVENGSDNLKRVPLNSDGTTGVEAKVADLGDGGGNFGDIAFSPDGILYVSSSGATLATYDPSNGSTTTLDNLSPSDKFQISFAGDSTLYLHQTGTGRFFYLDESGSPSALVEVSWSTATGSGDDTLTLTDLTGNKPLIPCEVCDASGELLAKYEFACVEPVYDEETGEFVSCNAHDFDLEEGDGSLVSYEAGNFEADEDGEPKSATFETDYCSVCAVVKSGQEFEIQCFDEIDGSFTVDRANDEKYAISFVAFFCEREDAEDFINDFPSTGKGKGGGRPD